MVLCGCHGKYYAAATDLVLYITTACADWLTRISKKVIYFLNCFPILAFSIYRFIAMQSLLKYYFWFLLLCIGLTLIAGVVAVFLPPALAGVVTAMPYLIAMIIVLYLFIHQQQRAPTQQERKKFTLSFTLIFWLMNFTGVFLGVVIASMSDPEVWTIFIAFTSNAKFISLSLIMVMLLAIPLYLITYWFYGAQAQRMANKITAKNK